VNKVLIITYELNNKTKDYTKFYETLKTSSDWWHYMETCWLLKTDESPQIWFERIKPYIDTETDYVFITEYTGNYYGWLPQEAWDWSGLKR